MATRKVSCHRKKSTGTKELKRLRADGRKGLRLLKKNDDGVFCIKSGYGSKSKRKSTSKKRRRRSKDKDTEFETITKLALPALGLFLGYTYLVKPNLNTGTN